MKIKVLDCDKNLEILQESKIPFRHTKGYLLTISISSRNLEKFILIIRYLKTSVGFVHFSTVYKDEYINVIEIYDHYTMKNYYVVENFCDKTIKFLKSTILTLLVDKNTEVYNLNCKLSYDNRYKIVYIDYDLIKKFSSEIRLIGYDQIYGVTLPIKVYINKKTNYLFVYDSTTGYNYEFYIGSKAMEPKPVKELACWK